MSPSRRQTLSGLEVRPLRGEQLLRTLHWALPLGRKYHPLVSLLNSRRGMIAIPFGQHQLVQPAAWRKQIANILLSGVSVVPEFELLAARIPDLKKGTLLDVGANIGLYTLLLRSVSDCPIIAYEPQPFLFKLFESNLSYNHIANVDSRNTACGSEDGLLAFNIGINGAVATDKCLENAEGSPPEKAPSDNWETEADRTQAGHSVVRVPVVTLDADLMDQTSIGLLKIDCEGFEYQILRGAMGLIKRHKPFLFLEIHPEFLKNFGNNTQQVVDLVSSDYDLEFWTYQDQWPKTKLGRSLAKFRKPRPYKYRDAAEIELAEKAGRCPSQVYCIGRPKSGVAC